MRWTDALMQFLTRKRQRETDQRLSDQLYDRTRAMQTLQEQRLERVSALTKELDAFTRGRRP